MVLPFSNGVNYSNLVYTYSVKVEKSGYKRKSNLFNVSSGAENRRALHSGAGAGTAMLFVARSDKFCNARWEARNDGRNRKIQKAKTRINNCSS